MLRKEALESSALRFGQGLVAAICLSIVIFMCAWALAEAYLNTIH